MTQSRAGDTAGAKVTAEEARNTLEPLSRDKPDDAPSGLSLEQNLVNGLSWAHALMGEKDLALKLAHRAKMLPSPLKGPVYEPDLDENLAMIQAIVGENNSAISTLTQLLQTPYHSDSYMTPITPALLRLDPIRCVPIRVSKNSARKTSRDH